MFCQFSGCERGGDISSLMEKLDLKRTMGQIKTKVGRNEGCWGKVPNQDPIQEKDPSTRKKSISESTVSSNISSFDRSNSVSDIRRAIKCNMNNLPFFLQFARIRKNVNDIYEYSLETTISSSDQSDMSKIDYFQTLSGSVSKPKNNCGVQFSPPLKDEITKTTYNGWVR